MLGLWHGWVQKLHNSENAEESFPSQGNSGWVLGSVLHQEGGWALGQAPQGTDRSIEPAGVQEAFGQCFQTQDLILGCFCAEPGAGPNNLCGSLPAQEIL